jgi:chromosome segregation ATPase
MGNDMSAPVTLESLQNEIQELQSQVKNMGNVDQVKSYLEHLQREMRQVHIPAAFQASLERSCARLDKATTIKELQKHMQALDDKLKKMIQDLVSKEVGKCQQRSQTILEHVRKLNQEYNKINQEARVAHSKLETTLENLNKKGIDGHTKLDKLHILSEQQNKATEALGSKFHSITEKIISRDIALVSKLDDVSRGQQNAHAIHSELESKLNNMTNKLDERDIYLNTKLNELSTLPQKQKEANANLESKFDLASSQQKQVMGNVNSGLANVNQQQQVLLSKLDTVSQDKKNAHAVHTNLELKLDKIGEGMTKLDDFKALSQEAHHKLNSNLATTHQKLNDMMSEQRNLKTGIHSVGSMIDKDLELHRILVQQQEASQKRMTEALDNVSTQLQGIIPTQKINEILTYVKDVKKNEQTERGWDDEDDLISRTYDYSEDTEPTSGLATVIERAADEEYEAANIDKVDEAGKNYTGDELRGSIPEEKIDNQPQKHTSEAEAATDNYLGIPSVEVNFAELQPAVNLVRKTDADVPGQTTKPRIARLRSKHKTTIKETVKQMDNLGIKKKKN